MKCKGEFVFRTLDLRKGGKFLNSDGKEIVYSDKYVLKVDEKTEDGKLYDRKFLIDLEQKDLIEELKLYPAYADLIIEFEIKIYNTQVKLVPIGLVD